MGQEEPIKSNPKNYITIINILISKQKLFRISLHNRSWGFRQSIASYTEEK